MLKRVCVTTADNAALQNLGRGGCVSVNPFKAKKGVIFTSDSFSFSDAEEFATKADWVAGIKAGSIFPMPTLNTYEDTSLEATYNESETQKRTITRQGEYRFNYAWNLPFDVHKKLQSFRNAAVRAFIVDEDGNVYGTNDNGVIKGFTISMINPLKIQFVGASADAPSLSRVEVDYNDQREWNVYGAFVPMAWSALTLEPLTDVNLEVVGVPLASSIVIRVYSSSGLASDGTVSKLGIAGIIVGDFVTAIGVSTGFTDNGDGTYTFAGSAMTAGTINLKAPAAMASEFGDFYIISTGAATVTIA